MKPLQCFFYPRGAAHIISQLELRIQQLEAELNKPEAQLRRLQNARSPQKELQQSIKEFIQKECTFSNGAATSLSNLYKAYHSYHKESPAPEIGLFSLALRSIAQELPLQYGRTLTGYTCQGISLLSEADLPAPHPQGQNSRPAAHPAHVCKEDPEWDSEQEWLTRLPNVLTPGTALDEVQDPDQDPFQVMPEPKLSAGLRFLPASAEGGTPNSSEAVLQPNGQTSNSEGASSK